MEIIKFIIIGSLAGFINGFFSAGGGMILVPFLIKFAKIPDKKAFATSISIILPLCLVSSAIFIHKNGFQMDNSWMFLVGGLVGGILSGFIFKNIPVKYLKKALGLLIIFAGIRSMF